MPRPIVPNVPRVPPAFLEDESAIDPDIDAVDWSDFSWSVDD
ncbi:hypothetical protein GCM10010989_31020 [Croceicoccus pelagius]|uniref:Uncharacterized protein n=1 Tax=Croceicoccus pelagius TaxID=1703341 RepID=A0A916YPL4_9SPHN|nr:hypothetical protein GCM10010989_31020 [Croceicoccus pelagius]